jgi:hypothetical protein
MDVCGLKERMTTFEDVIAENMQEDIGVVKEDVIPPLKQQRSYLFISIDTIVDY